MLKKIFFRLSVLLDTLKGILVFFLVWILIIFFGCMIIHNLLKIQELSNIYVGDYKKLVELDDDKMMNVIIYGEGEHTIVILPGFGSQSPVLQYKAIADKLKDNYRVAVVEYFGYGFSLDIDKERTLDNIVSEVQFALHQKEIYQYILMPHSMSNLYAMKMAEAYPESVQAIISLDGLYPAQYKESYFYEEYLDLLHNVEITAALESCGFARILSYVYPEMYYINKMTDEGVWGREEVYLLRNRIATKYLTNNMVEEMRCLKENATELKDYKYPEYLPVLQLLSSDSVDKYKNLKDSKKIDIDLNKLANDMITNNEIQLVQTIAGNHDMQFTNYETVADLTRQFIENGTVEYQEPVEETTDGEENVDNVIPEDEVVENKVVEEIILKNEPTYEKPATNQIYDPTVSNKTAISN